MAFSNYTLISINNYSPIKSLWSFYTPINYFFTIRNLDNSSDTFSSDIGNSSDNRKNARGVAAIAYVVVKGVAAIRPKNAFF